MFGQPPQSNLFPWAMSIVMEDVAEPLNESMAHLFNVKCQANSETCGVLCLQLKRVRCSLCGYFVLL